MNYSRFRSRGSSFEQGQVRGENHDCYGHTGNDVLGRSVSSGAFNCGLAREDEALYDKTHHISPLRNTSAHVALASTCSASTSSMSARNAFDHASAGVLRCQWFFLTSNLMVSENALVLALSLQWWGWPWAM